MLFSRKILTRRQRRILMDEILAELIARGDATTVNVLAKDRRSAHLKNGVAVCTYIIPRDKCISVGFVSLDYTRNERAYAEARQAFDRAYATVVSKLLGVKTYED